MVRRFEFSSVDELISYFDNFDNIKGSLFTTIELYSEHSFFIKLQLIDIVKLKFKDNVLIIFLNGGRIIKLLVLDDLMISSVEDFELEDDKGIHLKRRL